MHIDKLQKHFKAADCSFLYHEFIEYCLSVNRLCHFFKLNIADLLTEHRLKQLHQDELLTLDPVLAKLYNAFHKNPTGFSSLICDRIDVAQVESKLVLIILHFKGKCAQD